MGAKTPPSLSSIQWRGALSRFRCFLGPRTICVKVDRLRQTAGEGQRRPGGQITAQGFGEPDAGMPGSQRATPTRALHRSQHARWDAGNAAARAARGPQREKGTQPCRLTPGCAPLAPLTSRLLDTGPPDRRRSVGRAMRACSGEERRTSVAVTRCHGAPLPPRVAYRRECGCVAQECWRGPPGQDTNAAALKLHRERKRAHVLLLATARCGHQTHRLSVDA